MIETAVFTSPDGGGTRWRLLGVAMEPSAPKHYMRFKFDVAGGQVLGYLVLWGSDEEVPLDDVRFDATSLSFRLPSMIRGVSVLESGFTRAPRLALALVGDREFRGFYVDDAGVRLDPDPKHELKLIREDEEVTSL